ncbi:winged helix-turn-helix domain-containing protein [Planctobacterium marinum]|uniref:OmpR/PhoB-type domain-containing protein n=1 Tax=Planctobacterium marinum TaxID=1631968 RepID=A0AA48HG37_9ALTE|nr:hypothetical protein MACH26_18290 [Planctobacterium marinum]
MVASLDGNALIHLTSAGVELDQKQQLVVVNGKILKLPFLSFKVLQQLFLNAPHAVSIDELINLCWSGQVVADETVVQRIALLRKSLSSAGIAEDCIENRRGEGYRWVYEVVELPKKKHKNHTTIIAPGALALMVLVVYVVFQPFKDNIDTLAFESESLQKAHQYRQQFNERSLQHAAELYSELLVVHPDNVAALAGQAMTLAHQVSKFAADDSLLDIAAQNAQYALELAPDDPFVLQAKGLVQDVSGDISGALHFYREALQYSDSELSLYGDIAYLLTIRGELVEAADYHLRSLQGNHEFRYSQLALWYDLLGMTANAELWFEQAVLLNPHNLTEQFAYVDWLIKQQRFQHAQTQLEQIASWSEKSCLSYLYQTVLAIQAGTQVSKSQLHNFCRDKQPEYFLALLWISLQTAQTPEQISHQMRIIEFKQWHWPNDFLLLALSDYALSGEAYPDYLEQAVGAGYRDSEKLSFLMQNGLLPDNQHTREILKELRISQAEALNELRALSVFEQLQSISQSRQ